MTIGSLFSGIGGLELGLERAGLGPILFQVEQDPFCLAVLEKHWPGVSRFTDVRTVGAELPHVDVLCGGFPCQDVSAAGKGAGLSGARSGLWFEFARIIEAIAPAWVVVENVTSGKRRWLPHVRRHLHMLGYRSRALGIAAQDVGAPHLRRRVFVVAHADRVDVREQCRRRSGTSWESAPVARVNGAEGAASDAVRLAQDVGEEGRRDVGGSWNGGRDGRAPVSAIRRVDDGISRRLDASRKRALGNAVVPQCAEIAGRVIRAMSVGWPLLSNSVGQTQEKPK